MLTNTKKLAAILATRTYTVDIKYNSIVFFERGKCHDYKNQKGFGLADGPGDGILLHSHGFHDCIR
jgi:hypothetical protein